MDAFLCAPGFEELLGGELARAGGGDARMLAPGVLVCRHAPRRDFVWMRQALPGAVEAGGQSVRELARAALARIADGLEPGAAPWALHALAIDEPGLGSRARLVAETLRGELGAERRRTARREVAADDPARRLLVQVLLIARERALVSLCEPLRDGVAGSVPAWEPGGGGEVSDPALGLTFRDRRSPSRAWRKVEEAWRRMGEAPVAGQHVVDLGAAPGGWSYAALARGAAVTAVDRAALAPAISRHPRLRHLRRTAVGWAPDRDVDWLLCDAALAPRKVLALYERWMERGWASRVVVTVKLTRHEDPAVLDGLRDRLAGGPARFAAVKHLRAGGHEATILVAGWRGEARRRG